MVIEEGTAEECAEALGMRLDSFHTAVNSARKQEHPRWKVIMTKQCSHCGQMFETEHGNSSICSECKAASGNWDEEFKARKKALRQAEKERKAIKAKKAKEFKFNKKKCKTCLYRLQLGDEKKQWYCGYCYYTGHKRPCDISPDCVAYEEYDEQKRKDLADNLKNSG